MSQSVAIPKSKEDLKFAAIAAVIAILSFGTSGPASAIALRHIPILDVVFGRCLIAAVVLLIVVRSDVLRVWRSLARRERFFVLLSGALLACHLGLFVAGIAYTSFSSAVTLVALEPIAVLVSGAVFFSERPTRFQMLGIAMAIAGALVTGFAGADAQNQSKFATPHSLKGDLMMVGAVVLYGFYFALNRALSTRTRSIDASLRKGVLDFCFAGLIYLSAAIASASGQWGLTLLGLSRSVVPNLSAVWAVLALGLAPTLIGHTMSQVASRKLPPVWVALMSPGEALGSLMIGIFLFKTMPSHQEAFGGLLILLGALLVGVGATRR